MKYLSSRFEEYVLECEKNNLHENMDNIFNKIKNNHSNLIFYGPSGIGKYTQALNYLKNFSPSKLKYERKFNFALNNKKDFCFKISDIHFEIDMELLGCNAKVLFNDVYNHIIDIFSTRSNGINYIVCKNFHCIHSELLDIFYSYMQTLNHKNLKVSFILITEHIGFIPENILRKCQIIPFRRPTKKTYRKCINVQINSNVLLEDIRNIKNVINNITILNNVENKIISSIIEKMKDLNKIVFLEFRDAIYDIFIYNIDVNECLYKIICHFIENGQINNQNVSDIIFESYKFFRYYNNNYRPIYHLERFLYYICTKINDNTK
jgi:DNA polymerase III delta prime subunit